VADKNTDEGRRRFMKLATFGIGGIMGAITAIPLVRYFLHPVGSPVVTTPDTPIDIAAESEIIAGAAPIRLPIVANGVRDAWNRADNVAVGSCWVSKSESGEITAFTSVCPHLGCSVSYSDKNEDFRCPCHNSAFALDGKKKDDGPAKRGLDPLEVTLEDGRVKVTYKRFRNDISAREPV